MDTTLLAELPIKSNGKSARFFYDRVEFDGKSIRYDDIAILSTHGMTTVHTFVGIPVGRSFDGVVSFKMNSGKMHVINLNSMSMFGIPIIRNPRKNEKLYPPLFDAVNSIVARYMAQKYIYAIQGGATVEVSNLTINSYEATSVSKILKKVTTINRANYRESIILDNYGVAVYDRPGELLWSNPIMNFKNVLLVPYILDAIFR